ncbi:MAG: endonuclease V [Tepidisphaeraceae bacterium]|jgi:deoxyribonuclease V
MYGKSDPKWPAIVQQWKATQQALAAKLRIVPLRPLPRFVAGADAAFSENRRSVLAAAVVYDRLERRIVEIARACRPIEFPYVPTFLSFREGPAVLEAVGKLRHPWGAICFDGQGYAHPRRCGLATHLSILLDRPGVGIAKSRLIGTFVDPPPQAGSRCPLMDGDEQIGLVLRTKDGTRPLFVSIGHRVDLESAAELALACVGRFRIPEPTRQADLEVSRLKRALAGSVTSPMMPPGRLSQ